MSEHVGDHWQVQEAKQRFSQVLRAVQEHGPQTITRRGEEVAVVVDINEYRRLIKPRKTFAEHLMEFPKSDTPDGGPNVFDEIEAERKNHYMREIELGD
jgi:prevent-host-death family protein